MTHNTQHPETEPGGGADSEAVTVQWDRWLLAATSRTTTLLSADSSVEPYRVVAVQARAAANASFSSVVSPSELGGSAQRFP